MKTKKYERLNNYKQAGEVDLIMNSRKGDRVAEQELLRRYQPLVHSIIRSNNFNSTRIPLPALKAEGTYWVKNSLNRFDPTFGVKPSTYVYSSVEGRLKRFVHEHQNMARISVGRIGAIGAMQRCLDEYENNHKRYPSDEEIKDYLEKDTGKKWPLIEIQRLKRELRNDYSASELLDPEGGETLGSLSMVYDQDYDTFLLIEDEIDSIVEGWNDPRLAKLAKDYYRTRSFQETAQMNMATDAEVKQAVKKMTTALRKKGKAGLI